MKKDLTFKIPAPRTNNRRFYCGPFAICAITGAEHDEVRAKINAERQRRPNTPVTGTFPGELRSVLRTYGYLLDQEWDFRSAYDRSDFGGKAPTFAAWLRQRKGDSLKTLYFVQLNGHYVVVKGRKMIDNHTKTPVFIRQAPHRRRRVVQVWEVYRD